VQARPDDVLAGKYRITRMLGEGGMGIVAEAVHMGLDHRVALKLLKRDMVRPEHRERFFREARAAGALRSEHVVAIKDVDTLPDDTPFLVMEYLDGADLGSVLVSRGTLPVEEATDYILQACHAIAEAHTLGIIHRDLKPANLFVTHRVDGSRLVKVLDFGIAKIIGPELARDLTTTSQYMGSPSYMSPEQVRSAKRVDARSDLWALGVILYQLVAGTLPFDGESTGDVFVKISTEPPRPFTPPTPAPGLEAVILRCLQKAPEERYQDILELAAALAPFAGVTGRARAEAVARVAGRPLLPVPAPAPAAPPTVTTLGASAGQSRAFSIRTRRGAAIAVLAAAIIAASAWRYLRVADTGASVAPAAPPARADSSAASVAPAAPPARADSSAASVAPAARPARADSSAASVAPAAPPARVDPGAASSATSVEPAAAAVPSATPDRAPGDASVAAADPSAADPRAADARAADASAPDASAVGETVTPEPARTRRPARRAGTRRDVQDSDFVEDRR
jgi:eukaryotic-like serine/threonine-protein kinase